jgi:hypothetical protein
LRWNETSDKWEFTDDGTNFYNIATVNYVDQNVISSLDDIGDVTITSASTGQFLKWSGSAWVNDAIDLGTDTTGNYVQNLVAGTGITLTNNSGEGATPTVAADTSVLVTLTETQTLTNKTLTSPSLTGTPTAPTATSSTSSTQIATTAFAATLQRDSLVRFYMEVI